jgi:sRNA-binding protein
VSTTLSLKTLPKRLPPQVAEAAKRARMVAHEERTAAEKRAARDAFRVAYNRVADEFPLAFRYPAPLAIGIDNQLYAHAERLGISKKTLRRIVLFHIGNPSYLWSVALRRPRRNLDGSIASEVDHTHALFAQHQLKQRSQSKKKAAATP